MTNPNRMWWLNHRATKRHGPKARPPKYKARGRVPLNVYSSLRKRARLLARGGA